ncbi:MAG: RidA family protein [Alphaproteobacteria bacterium]
MARKRILSGSTFEDLAGYARAVVDGDWVFVSGTTGYDYATMTISDDPVAQTEQCFRNIKDALDKAGSSLADLVRIRVYIARREDFPAIAGIVGRHCRDARPANTTICAQLADEAMKVEIEVTALKQTG